MKYVVLISSQLAVSFSSILTLSIMNSLFHLFLTACSRSVGEFTLHVKSYFYFGWCQKHKTVFVHPWLHKIRPKNRIQYERKMQSILGLPIYSKTTNLLLFKYDSVIYYIKTGMTDLAGVMEWFLGNLKRFYGTRKIDNCE